MFLMLKKVKNDDVSTFNGRHYHVETQVLLSLKQTLIDFMSV